MSERERAIEAARRVDWEQVALNGGPPCFALVDGDGTFCLRAKRWEGHGAHHAFVSLDALLNRLLRAPAEGWQDTRRGRSEGMSETIARLREIIESQQAWPSNRALLHDLGKLQRDIEALFAPAPAEETAQEKVWHHYDSATKTYDCGVAVVRGNSMPEWNHVTCPDCFKARDAKRAEETTQEGSEDNYEPKHDAVAAAKALRQEAVERGDEFGLQVAIVIDDLLAPAAEGETTQEGRAPNRFRCNDDCGIVSVQEDGTCATCGADTTPVYVAPAAEGEQDAARLISEVDRENAEFLKAFAGSEAAEGERPDEEVPDPPEAPPHWDNAQASAWESGWRNGWANGYAACLGRPTAPALEARLDEIARETAEPVRLWLPNEAAYQDYLAIIRRAIDAAREQR